MIQAERVSASSSSVSDVEAAHTYVSGFDQGQIKDSGVSLSIRTKIILNTTNMKFIIHLCQINRADSYLSIVLAGGHFEVLLRDLLSNCQGMYTIRQFEMKLQEANYSL